MTTYHVHEGYHAAFSDDIWCHASVTPTHPVIVIDPQGDGPDVMVELVEAYRDRVAKRGIHDPSFDAIGDWTKVLTEYATPKPAKPEEPIEFGARVTDADGVTWVRVRVLNTLKHPWMNEKGVWRTWADIDVTAEGVES